MSPLDEGRRDLVAANLKLAAGASRPWRHAHQWLWDEIEGAANLALVRAAGSWDESSGITFAAYAFPRIRRAAWGVVDLDRRRGHGPGDAAAGPVPDPAPPGWKQIDGDDAFEAMLAPLKARSREVIRLIYREGLDCTQAARKIRLSRETVSRIRSKALRTLALTRGLHI